MKTSGWARADRGGARRPFPCDNGDCGVHKGLLEARLKWHGEDLAIILHVKERIGLPSDCARLEFENVSKHTENTLFSTSFTMYSQEVHVDTFGGATNVNGNVPTYTNGREFLSYITKGSAPQGTWIVGDQPGKDRGFIFTDVHHASRAPAGLLNWKWLRRDQWEADESVRVTCTSAPRSSHFYVVEVLANSLGDLAIGQEASGVLLAHLFFDETSGPAWTLDLGAGGEVPLESVSVLAEIGETLQLIPALSVSKGRGLLLKIEALLSQDPPGWELLLHKLDEEGGEDRVIVSQGTPFLTGGETKITVRRRLPWETEAGFTVGSILQASSGDYLWVWYRGPELRGTHDATVRFASSVHETLLLCVTPGAFRFFPTDREAAMRREELEEDTDLVTISSDGKHLHLPHRTDHSRVRVSPTGVKSLGKADDLVRYLERHLKAVDVAAPSGDSTVFSRPPACFFYHSSVSIPVALVYAAEIVCLLTGAKPVVMTQYDTPSEKQWKAPLVRPLLRGLTALIGKNESCGLGMAVFRFGRDTSLVLFRENRRYLADALLPARQTQALHPVPYPDEAGDKERLQRDHHDQVYNSAWNGLVLGYPPRFVDMYCADFHNPLSVREKIDIARKARADLESTFAEQSHLPLVEIGAGLDAPLDTHSMSLLYDAVRV
tara:strand:+ start:322 stop:2313 length:1992 start_codon:yes stop_codon:yes gene_type:complete